MIERANSFKLLGVSCQSNMKWNFHIKEITRKGNRRLCHLRQCRKAHLPTEVGLQTYCTKISPLLEYAAPVWAGLPHYLVNDLERIQIKGEAYVLLVYRSIHFPRLVREEIS